MRNYNFPLATNAPMNTAFTSDAMELFNAIGYSIQAEFTGSVITGTFVLQGSDDPIAPVTTNSTQLTPTNWTPILNSNYSVSGAGSYVWNVSDVMYNYVRLVYADGSGGTSTGILNARINVRGP
jgi:hypothetical protein